MKQEYTNYEEVTKEVLDSLQIGNLVKVNDWKRPMRVVGMSDNYVAMIQKQFKDTLYSVIEKKQRVAGNYNCMRKDHFHCGPDNWVFGDMEFDYKFDNQEAINKYLAGFELSETSISERNGIAITSIQIKK